MWLVYHEIEETSIGTRIGGGQQYLFDIDAWKNTLSEEEIVEWQEMFPEPRFLKNREALYTQKKYYNVVFWRKDGLPKYYDEVNKQSFCIDYDFTKNQEPCRWYDYAYEVPFNVSHIEYNSLLHYIVAMKADFFEGIDSFENIIRLSDTKEIREAESKIKGYSAEVWDELKYSVVLMGNYYKFMSNPDLIEKLLEVKDFSIIEADLLLQSALHEVADEIRNITKSVDMNLADKFREELVRRSQNRSYAMDRNSKSSFFKDLGNKKGQVIDNGKYYCYVIKSIGIICYNASSNKLYYIEEQYKLSEEKVAFYDFIAIGENCLFYKKQIGSTSEICRINIDSKEKIVMKSRIEEEYCVFPIVDGKVVDPQAEDLKFIGSGNNVISSSEGREIPYIIFEQNLLVEGKGGILVIDMQTKAVTLLESEECQIEDFLIFKNKIYVIKKIGKYLKALVAIVEGKEIACVKNSLTYYADSTILFYRNHIVCSSGIYDLACNFVSKIQETMKKEIIDGKTYYVSDNDISIISNHYGDLFIQTTGIALKPPFEFSGFRNYMMDSNKFDEVVSLNAKNNIEDKNMNREYLKTCIPKNKFDFSALPKLRELTGEEINLILSELMEGYCDANWPVTRELTPILKNYPEYVMPYIIGLLKKAEADEEQQLFCLYEFGRFIPNIYRDEFKQVLQNLVEKPTSAQTDSGVDGAAKNLLARWRKEEEREKIYKKKNSGSFVTVGFVYKESEKIYDTIYSLLNYLVDEVNINSIEYSKDAVWEELERVPYLEIKKIAELSCEMAYISMVMYGKLFDIWVDGNIIVEKNKGLYELKIDISESFILENTDIDEMTERIVEFIKKIYDVCPYYYAFCDSHADMSDLEVEPAKLKEDVYSIMAVVIKNKLSIIKADWNIDGYSERTREKL